MNKKHLHEFAQTRILHLQICAQRKMWHVQICDFCIWKNICAADLRILCTDSFCTFADLRFAHLHICTFVFLCFAFVREIFRQVKMFCEHARTWKFLFFTLFTKISLFSKFEQNLEKVEISEMSDSVPSVLTCSRKCPKKAHVFLSGTRVVPGPTRLTTQGGKSRPEYALIRIAAGAPDLAKSPNPPPDGPGRPRKSRHFSLRTEKLPDSAPGLAFAPQAEILSGAVFPDPRTTRPSRQTDSEARRVLRQSPTHSANVRTLRKTLAENRRQGQRHSCTPCTPCTTETEPCTLVHNRATTPRHKWQRTHRPCVALVGEEGGAERPRAIESIRLISSNLLYNFNSTISMYICYSRYATAKSRTTKGKNSEWGDHTRIRTRNFVGLDEMPPTLRGRFSTDGKRTQKGAQKASPFLYIYSLQRAFFGRF